MGDIYAWFDARIDLSVANSAALPSSGNWKGRRAITEDTGVLYWYNGTAWKRVVSGLKLALMKTKAQNTVSGNTTVITWSDSAAPVDVGGFYSTSQPTRLTAPVSGTYVIRVNIASNSVAARSLGYQKNGAGLAYFAANAGASGAAAHIAGQLLVNLTGGDYIELVMLDSGTASAFDTTAMTNVTMELIA